MGRFLSIRNLVTIGIATGVIGTGGIVIGTGTHEKIINGAKALVTNLWNATQQVFDAHKVEIAGAFGFLVAAVLVILIITDS